MSPTFENYGEAPFKGRNWQLSYTLTSTRYAVVPESELWVELG